MYSDSPYMSWSLINPRPIVVYVKKHDEHLVYWNGYVMTHAHALQIMLMPYGIYASPKVKSAITKRFKQLYTAGLFGDVAWDRVVHSNEYYKYVVDKVETHVREITKGVDIYDAVKWLDTTDAKVVDKSNPE